MMLCQNLICPASMGKLAAVSLILIFCFAECAAGSCLSYGHSCWGAHGKRSGERPIKGQTNILADNPNWFISRLFSPVKTESDQQGLRDTDAASPLNTLAEIDYPAVIPLNDEALYSDDALIRSRLNDKEIQLYNLMARKLRKQGD